MVCGDAAFMMKSSVIVLTVECGVIWSSTVVSGRMCTVVWLYDRGWGGCWFLVTGSGDKLIEEARGMASVNCCARRMYGIERQVLMGDVESG